MTAPNTGPPTEIDPGRERPPALGGLADAPTQVDPGRASRGEGPTTVVDPGRRPVAAAGPASLPAALAERFEVLRDLTGSGAQGHLFHVRARDGGAQWALKVGHPGTRLEQEVSTYLPNRRSRHIVHVEEIDTAGDRQYELMEYATGGNLLEWSRTHTSGLDAPTIAELVRQLAEGLVELHRAHLVHRDLKPANVLIRTLESLEFVLADFGISRFVPLGERIVPERSGTMPYLPPEFISGGMVTAAYDWWSLGVMILELATGGPLFAGIDDDIVRATIGSRPIAVPDMDDDRLRLLCRGLLLMDPHVRWGVDEVGEWLRGGSPGVASVQPEPATPRAGEPYEYLGTQYWDRDLLATTMTADWGVARAVLFGDDPAPRNRLTEWLTQFPELPQPQGKPHRRAPDDVRLLYVLRAVDPRHPPVYRGQNITPSRLPALANEGIERVGTSADIVEELWSHGLLPLLATGSAGGGLSGGNGLLEIRTRWQSENHRLHQLARAIPEPEPRVEWRRILREDPAYALSLSLLAATATTDHRDSAVSTVAERAATLNLPWFTDLAGRPGFTWIAFALIRYATAEAGRRDAAERERRAREDWQRRMRHQREWSRRQNRPQALGYAAAGVAALAVLLFGLVGVSDWAEVATDAQIIDAWLAVVVALAGTTVAEALLAWDAGGRFHPAYSFLGAGAVVLGRIATNLLARRVAVPVVLAVLGGLVALTIFLPVVSPFAVAALVVAWTVQRHLAWRAQEERERHIVAAG